MLNLLVVHVCLIFFCAHAVYLSLFLFCRPFFSSSFGFLSTDRLSQSHRSHLPTAQLTKVTSSLWNFISVQYCVTAQPKRNIKIKKRENRHSQTPWTQLKRRWKSLSLCVSNTRVLLRLVQQQHSQQYSLNHFIFFRRCFSSHFRVFRRFRLVQIYS